MQNAIFATTLQQISPSLLRNFFYPSLNPSSFLRVPTGPPSSPPGVCRVVSLLSMDRPPNATAAGAYAILPPPPEPMAAPVVPVDLTVVKRRLGGGGDMAVHDASGGLVFRVTAADDGRGRGRALLDASGCALVTVRSSEGEWQAFRGSSSEQKDIIFTAKVIPACSSRKEVYVFVPPRSTSEGPKPSYKLVGNSFQRACTVIKESSIVAQTNLLYKLKKAFYSRRKFRVTIYPANDTVLIMAMIMTFFVVQ